MKRIKLLSLLALVLASASVFPQQAANIQDSLALVDLYDSTNGPNWNVNFGWKQGPVSSWYGVTLTGDRVTALDLSGNFVAGSLPASFGKLTGLQSLLLSFNQIHLLPESFGNLTSLHFLSIEFNELYSLPESFGNLTGLQTLFLSSSGLGDFPQSFGNLSNLKSLYLGGNGLSSLPEFFGNLTGLQALYLTENRLRSLPESFGNLTNLQTLDLNFNRFTFAGLEWVAQHLPFADYSEQSNIELLKKGNTLITSAGGTPENNTFYWYRDEELDTTIKADSTYMPLRAGSYRVEANNAIATQLTLFSFTVDFVPVCEDCPTTWYRDADGDGFGNPASTKVADKQPRGYVSNNLDCNDKNKVKGGPEVCDGIDNDCDGIIDDGLTETTFYSDFDGDGYGSPKRSITTCAPPPRFVLNSEDRNDDNKNVYPGAPEICDGRDNNQNGVIDEGFVKTTFYHDFDKDGYGRATVTLQACAAPLNYVARAGDCNDRDASIHPGATGSCNGIDDDCDGLVDENCTVLLQQGKTAKNAGEQGLQLQLTALPNPSSHAFTLRLQSSSEEPVQLRIVDAVGSVIEVRQGLSANTSVSVGHRYRPGVYYAQLWQGDKRTYLKLIKASQ